MGVFTKPVEFAMSVAATKQAILSRVFRRPEFSVVPEHAIKLFDRVIEQNEAEGLRKFPKDEWGRIQFWKEEIMKVTLPQLRGVIAVYYHEYMAALRRNESLAVVPGDDEFGFMSRPYNPHAEAIAQRDAYLACTASLR